MSSSSSSSLCLSNLQRFLSRVAPHVPLRTLPESCCKDLNSQWLPFDNGTIKYFTLKDVWDCYEEWSTYGAGIPLTSESCDTPMQYYVPYLSAIQVYTSKSFAASRIRREDSEGAEFEFDSWSEEDSGSDNLSRSLSNNSSKAWDAISLDSSSDQVSSWPTRDMLGYLYLQYNENSPPCQRVPFAEKVTLRLYQCFLFQIAELARSHPALMALNSVDISPASWMAVAWYPIYCIPTQKNEKNMAASFLTYHTLSSSFQDWANQCEENDTGNDTCCSNGWRSIIGEECKKKNSGCISLSPFGLATYKMQRDIWLNSDPSDNQSVLDMYNAADSWLKQLNSHHHDFNFFTLHSTL
ncbi:hypothetical protein RJT34_23358 [Clitoria ternatea]|uniref:Uncharacterized protein n=1 Tax=Clitoria ternatea TaxID=43366 RepID=A0AAN9FLG9_CLITE